MKTITKIILVIAVLVALGLTAVLLMKQAEGDEQTTNNITMSEYQTTDSGLQYKIIKESEGGEQPQATDQVEVHYEGKLTDGTIFDSSRQRGQTITFGLNQVIAGWTEGLQLMSEGDTYELYIPAHLAYGANGVPGAIPPNADLIFEVELIRVIK